MDGQYDNQKKKVKHEMRSASYRLQSNVGLENDGRSMVSASSAGSATLIDVSSQRSNVTINASQVQQFRKFTSAVGKPGQARETREAVSKAMNACNPIRSAPIATPMDYEKFVVEKSAQLEHDKDRDLLLFLRDDISESEYYPKERSAVPSVTIQHLKEAQWLLCKDALNHYSSSYKIINFNYAKFSGDFKKLEVIHGLNHLKFESDIALEEEKLLSNGQQLSSDVIKEGFLVVMPGDSSFVDNFRSEKKRYCIVRRDDEGRVMMEVFKQQNQQQIFSGLTTHVPHQPPLEIKSAILKTTKKGKTVLQVAGNPDLDKRALILAAEADAELAMWLVEIDRALTWNNREDSFSLSSSGRGTSIQPNGSNSLLALDTESITSDDSSSSIRDMNLGMVWRGRNAAAKALHPPIVERRNIFSLYWDLESLFELEGESSSLILTSSNEQKIHRNTTTSLSTRFFVEKKPQKSDTPLLDNKQAAKLAPLAYFESPSKSFYEPTTSTSAGVNERIDEHTACLQKTISPSPSQSSFSDEKPSILFVAEFKQLNVKLLLGNSTPEQIEPFFLHFFLFDASNGTRISEEFQLNVPCTQSSNLSASSSTFGTPTSFELNHSELAQFKIKKLNGISQTLISHAEANKLIFAISNPRPDIYLVAKVKRLLSDCPYDVYTRSGVIDAKAAVKITKSINMAMQKLSRYKSMFAWTVKPVFPSMCNAGGLFTDSKNLQLFKCDGRLTDFDLQKNLSEFSKLEKSGKLMSIPGASLTIETEITSTVSDLPMIISPSLLPLRPWRAPPDSPLAPAFELQSFVTDSLTCEPFKSFVNLLYVHPISLTYGNQKAFNRARNISCTVRFIGSQTRNAENINAIIDRTDRDGPLVHSKTCTVQYHEQNPQFNDEIKVQLPCALDAGDHLLFTFTHISVANALSPKSSNEPFESSIGYAWLPLVCETENSKYLIMSEDVQDFDLSVAINLPPNYSVNHLNGSTSSGNNAAPDIKFVDNGRPLFRVRLRLISSVFTSDECTQSFFQCYQTLQNSGYISLPLNEQENYAVQKERLATESFECNLSSINNGLQQLNRSCSPYVENSILDEISGGLNDVNARLAAICNSNLLNKEEMFKKLIAKVKALASIEMSHLIPFLHVILNRLLILLTCSHLDELSLNTLNVIIIIVDRVADVKIRNEFLRDFVYLHARCKVSSGDVEQTTHDALLKFIPMLIRNVQGDHKALSSIFRQLWFLLDCTIKFMTQYLIENKLFKMLRRERFPVEFLFRIEAFVQFLISQIIARHKDLPTESRQANVALAYFLKYCLSITDRHVIMNEIHYIIDKLDSSNSRALRMYKLEMLRIVSGHEHWIPLCLPLLTDKLGSVMRSDSGGMSAILDSNFNNNNTAASKSSGGFFSKFFAQIFSTSGAVQESTEADRYANYVEHFYLSPTYCRTHFLASFLFQELVFALRDPRDYRRQVITLLRNLLSKHSADLRYTDSSAQNRIAVLYTPIIRIAIENIRELEATAKTSAESPDLSPLPTHNSNFHSLKNRTLTSEFCNNFSDASQQSSLFNSCGIVSTASKSLRSSTSKAATLPSQILPSDLHFLANNNFNNASTYNSSNVNTIITSTNNTAIAVFAEKLDKHEAKDLILCVLFVLNRLPKRTLGALWCAQETIKNNSEIASNSACVAVSSNQLSSNTSGGAISTSAQTNVYLDFIRMLELALFMFRYRGRSYHVREQAKRQKSALKTLVNFQSVADQHRSCTLDSHASNATNLSSITMGMTLSDEASNSTAESGVTAMSFLQDCHLTQEVALIVLDTAQTLANQIATRAKQLSIETIDAAFHRLLKLEIQLLDVSWPENVRLHALAALAVFINLFSSRFFQSGPLDCLSSLIEALLLQLNSRFVRVQNAAAALLQLVLRNGFDVATSFYAPNASNFSPTKSSLSVERLGRPGTQTGVALAHLLGGQKPLSLKPGNQRFERGLNALESFVVNYGDRRVPSMFEKGVIELIKQLRGVLEATTALSEAANDPIRLADLHIQLANSYRGSAALRCAWFDTLANIHIAEKWFSEAAVCQAHAIAIIGKELMAKGEIKIDWDLLNMINENIAKEENVYEHKLDSTQQAGYTVENFTTKVEQTLQTLVLSERYEAVGPLCRLIIPIYESNHNYKALVSLYAELQQAYSRAAEIKASGKRHLGSYFRVVLYGVAHFGSEHKTEWIYREPRLTSLAESCDRMVEFVHNALGHNNVEILPPERDFDESKLKISVAYIQVTHVEPCSIAKLLLQQQKRQNTSSYVNGSNTLSSIDATSLESDGLDSVGFGRDSCVEDPMCYNLHTNVKTFVYEERITDETAPKSAPEQARLAVKRIVLTVEKSFPNTRRRQRVVGRTEFILTPLDVACDSLLFKAAQIRKILNAAGITRGAYGVDKTALRRLDLKQLQLFLQGSVSPTVNAGVLAYAEAFTASAQQLRYGTTGISKLVSAFKVLMTELAEALRINETAIGNERSEYQSMLKNSFDGMLERLSAFFGGEKFILTHKLLNFDGSNVNSNVDLNPAIGSTKIFGMLNADGNIVPAHFRQSATSAAAMHILDSIGGVNA